MKKMCIYEPAMCCDTGICGIGFDPELLRISAVLNALKKNGVSVGRFNLNSAPMAFVTDKAINELIKQNGVEALPAVVLDGEIVITGRYPTNDEFASLLKIPQTYLTESKAKNDSC
ncbi:MAG: arsenite efflux transporter metallochaperone ArsD [Candidatus Adiutrix sp.]